MDEMLYPGVGGVVHRRHPEFPAHVLPQIFAAPIAHVERRVGENEIGLEVGMQIRPEAVGVAWAEIGLNAANGEVHPRQFPSVVVRFLSINGDVAMLPPCSSTNFSDCTNMPPEPLHGSNTRLLYGSSIKTSS